MTKEEAGRRGGRSRQANLTPEQRTALGRKGRLSQAVREVVDRAPELSADQLARIRAILTTEAPGGESP